MKTGKRRCLKIVFCGTAGMVLLLSAFLAVSYKAMDRCGVSDSAAMAEAKGFADKFGIKYPEGSKVEVVDRLADIDKEPIPFIKKLLSKYLAVVDGYFRYPERKKTVNFGGFTVGVGCGTGEVVEYYNLSLYRKARDQRGTGNPAAPGKEASEERALAAILSIASNLGVPEDMSFRDVSPRVDSFSGLWVRQRDGYDYADDYISIDVTDNTNDFYAMEKSYSGTECPTDVVVSKADAILIVRKRLAAGIKPEGMDDFSFDVGGLKIVRPEYDFGKPYLKIRRSNSRLAWVISYSHTPSGSLPEYGALPGGVEDTVTGTIWIDAENGDYLGGR